MATYKVLQDIEAEDKLLGPLTLKQFVFAAVTFVIGIVQFNIITSSVSIVIKLPFVIALLFPMLIFGFMALPIGREQSNDIWLLARLRFLFKPRRRIWDQNGISDLVTITAPKRAAEIYTNGLSQTEVSSRLEALATTLDSRGWAIKNVNVNLYAQPGYAADADDDRLVAPSSLPQDVPFADVQASDDMLDEHNPVAHQLEEMIITSTQHRHESIKERLRTPEEPPKAPPADFWFMNQPDEAPKAPQIEPDYATFDKNIVAPGAEEVPVPEPSAEEQAVMEHVVKDDKKAAWNKHMRTILPIEEQKALAAKQQEVSQQHNGGHNGGKHAGAHPADTTETPAVNPAILGLARNNDWSVATTARYANQLSKGQGADDEVVVSLR